MLLTSDDSVVASTTAQLSTYSDGEVIILSLIDQVYYGLDGVGARLWELIQEPRTVAFLVQAICDEYDVDPQQCAMDINVLFTELSQQSFIEITPAANS